MRRKILVVFLFTSIFVAIIMLFIAGDHANKVAIYKNLLLSFYLFLSIWLMIEKLNNYGLALLLSVISILIFGMFHSFWIFTAFLGFLFTIFLYGFRKSICSVKYSICLDISLMSVISIGLASVAISGMARGYGDLWIDYKILNANLHIDTLFHIASANMINNYHTISTGLHGLPFMGNHVFSHFLYGNISNIFNVFTYQVYGYTTFIVFIPLLFVSSMSFAEELVPSRNNFSLYISFLILISIFIGFLGRLTFDKYGLLWDSYFISESYLVSLIILYAFLSYLLNPVRKPHFILSLLFLIVLSTSKISVGLMGLIILLIREWFSWGDYKDLSATKLTTQISLVTLKREVCSISLVKMAVYAIVFSYISSLFFTGSQNDSHYNFELLSYAKLHLSQYVVEKLGIIGSLFVYLFTHNFFVLLSIVLMTLYYFLERRSFNRLKEMFLFMILVSIVGFMFLNIKGLPGVYYFTNISMFFAIPILLSSKNYISMEAFSSNIRGIAVFSAIIICFGTYGCMNYGFPYVIKTINQLKRQKTHITGTSLITPYIEQLKKINRNDVLKKFLVYVPKQESNFWTESNITSIKNAFIIPAISGHPALFGLPHAMRHGYGYDNYHKTVFNEAGADKICRERLCEETRRLGFEGYIMVGSSSFEIVKCQNQYNDNIKNK